MGADMTLYAVLDIHRGEGVDDIGVLETLNQRIEDLDDVTLAALVDQCWFDELPNAEDLATVLDGDSSTYRDAAFAEITAAIQQSAAEIFLGNSRDLTRFVDSAGRAWIMTGGPTHGDPPTDSCNAVRMLDSIGVSAQTINKAPEPVEGPNPPTCPNCNDGEGLASVETVEGHCRIDIDDSSGEWSHGEDTTMNWQTSITTGWYCHNCWWTTNDRTWIDKFSPESTDS